MGKITKAQSKLHDEALALLSLSRPLTLDEREVVFRQFNPLAEHNIGKNAVYFTPFDLAWEHAVMTQPKGDVIDLCAGIGVLAYQNLRHDRAGYLHSPRGDIRRMVCVEINPEFVEIGKKLVPEAEWYCADVFDLDFISSLGSFDVAISNPPYGNLPKSQWLKVKGPAQWQVIELILRLAWNGGMVIIPAVDCDYSFRTEWVTYQGERHAGYRTGYQANPKNREKYLDQHFPGVNLIPAPVDCEMYRDQWVGAAPTVQIVDVNVDDVEWERPFGFSDVELAGLPLFQSPRMSHAQSG